MVSDNASGARLLKTEFRVLVEIAPPCDELIIGGLSFVVEGLEQVHGVALI